MYDVLVPYDLLVELVRNSQALVEALQESNPDLARLIACDVNRANELLDDVSL